MRAPGTPAGEPQVWYGDRPAITLGKVTYNIESSATATAKFRVFTPDSRLKVKVSVLFVKDSPDDPSPVTAHAATLYLGSEDKDASGKFGGSLLTTDILRNVDGDVIHQSAPLAIPEDAGLAGFSQEFLTSGDSILGILAQGEPLGPSGMWVLQVRYQPDGQRLCDADWEWLKRKCHAQALGGSFAIG